MCCDCALRLVFVVLFCDFGIRFSCFGFWFVVAFGWFATLRACVCDFVLLCLDCV